MSIIFAILRVSAVLIIGGALGVVGYVAGIVSNEQAHATRVRSVRERGLNPQYTKRIYED